MHNLYFRIDAIPAQHITYTTQDADNPFSHFQNQKPSECIFNSDSGLNFHAEVTYCTEQEAGREAVRETQHTFLGVAAGFTDPNVTYWVVFRVTHGAFYKTIQC